MKLIPDGIEKHIRYENIQTFSCCMFRTRKTYSAATIDNRARFLLVYGQKTPNFFTRAFGARDTIMFITCERSQRSRFSIECNLWRNDHDLTPSVRSRSHA